MPAAALITIEPAAACRALDAENFEPCCIIWIGLGYIHVGDSEIMKITLMYQYHQPACAEHGRSATVRLCDFAGCPIDNVIRNSVPTWRNCAWCPIVLPLTCRKCINFVFSFSLFYFRYKMLLFCLELQVAMAFLDIVHVC